MMTILWEYTQTITDDAYMQKIITMKWRTIIVRLKNDDHDDEGKNKRKKEGKREREKKRI